MHIFNSDGDYDYNNIKNITRLRIYMKKIVNT